MIFSSFKFIFLFLPVSLLVFYCLRQQSHKKIFLLLASIFFYASWKIEYVPIILISILGNYLLHLLIYNKKIKFYFVSAIAFNLGLLAIFKYKYFFLQTFGLYPSGEINQVIPLGISFFTFQQIAFQSDLYNKKVKKNNLLDFSLFVCFFPQLVAGPIVHYSNIIPQFKNKIKFNARYFTIGLFVFTCGLFKKAVIADQLGKTVNLIFNKDISGIGLYDAWVASMGYTYQLYFDFSGYSEMAIGIALFFGIKLPLNFYSPYKSTSIIEFWRRWHITLSQFLKDYLYIPLGGNRKGSLSRYKNLFITMLLGGLWHGAGFTFVIWGAIHGLALIINNLFKKTKIKLPQFVSWSITFIFVVIAWIFFRAQTANQAALITRKMFNLNDFCFPPLFYKFFGSQYNYCSSNYSSTVALIILCFLICAFLPNVSQIVKSEELIIKNKLNIKSSRISFKPNFFYMTMTLIMFSVSLYFISTGTSTFLYFEF